MINEPPSLNRDYNRDPNMKALKRRGVINQGSTLGSGVSDQGLKFAGLRYLYKKNEEMLTVRVEILFQHAKS